MANISKHSFDSMIPNVYLRSCMLNKDSYSIPLLPGSPGRPTGTITVDLGILFKVIDTDHLSSIRRRLRLAVCLFLDHDEMMRALNLTNYLKNKIRSSASSNKVKIRLASFEDACFCECEEQTTRGIVEIINDDNDFVKNYKLSVNFECDDISYDYMGCMLVPYIAEPNVEVSSGVRNTTFPTGASIAEDILVNNEAPERSHIYFLEEGGSSGYGNSGQLWAGPFHKHNNALMAGGNHGQKSHPYLRSEGVDAAKIIDSRNQFSIASMAHEARQSFMNHYKSYFQQTQKLLFEDLEVLKTFQSRDYFSPITYSRKLNDSVAVMFGVDIQKLSKNIAKYQFLYNSSNFSDSISIKDVTVYRRRVRHDPSNNKLTGIPYANRWFDANEEEEIIGKLSDENISWLSTATGYRSGIRQYFATDNGMSTITDGLYRYGVRIELQDNSISKLKFIINRLTTALDDYKIYIKNAEAVGGIDCNSDSFTVPRIRKLLEMPNRPWEGLVSAYASTVSLVASTQTDRHHGESTIDRLGLLSHPRYATPGSIVLAKQIVEQLVARLNSLLNSAPTTNNSQAMNYRSKIDSVTPDLTIVDVEHEFMSSYNARTVHGRGLNYTSGISPSSGPLRIYTHAAWTGRINKELSRYGLTKTSAKGLDIHAYLSPETIVMPKGTNDIVISKNMKSDSSIEILLANNNPAKVGLDLSYETRGSRIDSKMGILAKSGITMELFRQGVGGFISRDRSCLSLVDSGEYLGAKSAFVHTTTTQEDDPALKGHEDATFRAYDNPIVNGIIKDYANGYKKVEISDLSNIPGSIAMKTWNKSPKMNNFSFNMVYNCFQEIQYLSGYRDGFVGAPVWTKLDRGTFDSMSKNGHLICRLKPVDTITKTKNPYTKSFSPYNQTFIIGNDPAYKTGTSRSVPAPALAPSIRLNRRDSPSPDLDIPVEYYRNPPNPDSIYTPTYVSNPSIVYSGTNLSPRSGRTARVRRGPLRSESTARKTTMGTADMGGGGASTPTPRRPSRGGRGGSGRGGGGKGY